MTRSLKVDKTLVLSNDRVGGARVAAAPVTASGAKPDTLRANQWRTVYSGPGVKCYAIKFTKLADPSNEDGNPAIAIYLDGDQDAHLAVSLTIGQSTEVCGKTIRVCGFLRGGQVAHWDVLDAQATTWFE